MNKYKYFYFAFKHKHVNRKLEKNAKVYFFSKVELSLTLDNSVNTTPNDIIHTRQQTTEPYLQIDNMSILRNCEYLYLQKQL